MPNWTMEEKAAWDTIVESLTSFYPAPMSVNVASKKRRAAILKADQIIWSDARFVVSIPANDDWKEDDRGINHERRFAVTLYIDRLRRSLEAQGFIVK